MNNRIISNELRNSVMKRDGYRCRYCGSKQEPFHMDHVYPYSKGGETTIDNLVTACQECNIKKSDKVGIWPAPDSEESVLFYKKELRREIDRIATIAIVLYSPNLRERILAASEKWPAMTGSAIALICDSSPAYVSEVLNKENAVV